MAVKVKVCGLTNLTDARAALDAGADLLGFIFYPKSPRHVSTSQAADIIASLQRNGNDVKTVGVFVNQSPQDIAAIMQTCGLDLAQLHGEEMPGVLNDPRLYGRAYKALRPRDALEAGLQAGVYAQPSADSGESLPAFLIDSYHPVLRGGSGQTGDWSMAANLTDSYPLLLAGGLTPHNVREAIQQVNPWGVDVASGVESEAGKKDHQAIINFINAVRDK